MREVLRMLRKPSCFGFGRSLVRVPTKNLTQCERRTDIERAQGESQIGNPEKNPDFSCDSYNNSRFACIGNLTTIRLNLVAWREGPCASGPKSTKFAPLWRKRRLVAAKHHLDFAANAAFTAAAAARSGKLT
jgi:hypothetical protein